MQRSRVFPKNRDQNAPHLQINFSKLLWVHAYVFKLAHLSIPSFSETLTSEALQNEQQIIYVGFTPTALPQLGGTLTFDNMKRLDIRSAFVSTEEKVDLKNKNLTNH
jgi:hypothetical protein|tara:strand:- start:21 stop:341 length:321 start_codon:yes stop_codon:yes gene_type:complete